MLLELRGTRLLFVGLQTRILRQMPQGSFTNQDSRWKRDVAALYAAVMSAEVQGRSDPKVLFESSNTEVPGHPRRCACRQKQKTEVVSKA